MLIPLNDIDGILFQAPNPRLTSAFLVCRISRSNSSDSPRHSSVQNGTGQIRVQTPSTDECLPRLSILPGQ
jgi:hypothetical protein